MKSIELFREIRKSVNCKLYFKFREIDVEFGVISIHMVTKMSSQLIFPNSKRTCKVNSE